MGVGLNATISIVGLEVGTWVRVGLGVSVGAIVGAEFIAEEAPSTKFMADREADSGFRTSSLSPYTQKISTGTNNKRLMRLSSIG